MSLLGDGAVTIWHDIAPEGRDQFYAWHGKEHMLERVGIPGFRRGRRYVAIQADLEFFNLYEVDTPAVLTGDGYRARLNAPTPWTKSTVVHFRSVARALCNVVASHGRGQGGLVATWRYDVVAGEAERHAATVGALLEELVASGAIAGAHLLAADDAASGESNAEERARGRRNDVPGWVIIVEGWGDAPAFADLVRGAVAEAALRAAGAEGPIATGIYQHQATVAEVDLD